MKAKSGFTLVEILIVVVILGILAAIVIPQFTSASTEAKESALVSDLQAMRSQIELYKIHHNDELPGDPNNSSSGVSFVDAMTNSTNQAGEVGSTALHRFGPYMRDIPLNPFNDLTTVEVDGTVGGDSHAWHFTTATGADRGLFQADDSGTNAVTGVAHTDY
ncbi:MAG: prepilin-type N-terminal cleavage/methylation domain-containing protein [Planctomycetota bacterium]|jgi:general secretion pathway protein G